MELFEIACKMVASFAYYLTYSSMTFVHSQTIFSTISLAEDAWRYGGGCGLATSRVLVFD